MVRLNGDEVVQIRRLGSGKRQDLVFDVCSYFEPAKGV